jgi:hypothetical protein
MSIPAVQSLARTVVFDRRHLSAEAVKTAMRRGAALHLHFDRTGPVWMLSDGCRASNEAAKFVLASVNVVSVGEALLCGATSQTFRYVN